LAIFLKKEQISREITSEEQKIPNFLSEKNQTCREKITGQIVGLFER
jgi:hypothetical protein